MVDVEDIKVLNRRDCECGHEFTLQDLNGLQRFKDTNGFYGNLVKNYSETKCPECGKPKILLLKQVGQTWEIMNTAEKKEIITAGLSQVEGQVTTNEYTTTSTTGEATIDSDVEIRTTEEFICPECKNTFKSKAGLSAHMRTHQK